MLSYFQLDPKEQKKYALKKEHDLDASSQSKDDHISSANLRMVYMIKGPQASRPDTLILTLQNTRPSFYRPCLRRGGDVFLHKIGDMKRGLIGFHRNGCLLCRLCALSSLWYLMSWINQAKINPLYVGLNYTLICKFDIMEKSYSSLCKYTYVDNNYWYMLLSKYLVCFDFISTSRIAFKLTYVLFNSISHRRYLQSFSLNHCESRQFKKQ